MELAEVRHAGVRRQRGLAVDELLERALGLAVAAQLDERVDQDRVRGDRVGLERAGPLGEPQRAAEVVPSGGERGGRDQLGRVLGAARERTAQHAVGAHVEAGVAGLARLLQVRAGELRLERRAAAHGGLEALDLGVGARIGADGAVEAGRRRRARRALVAAAKAEDGERAREREHGCDREAQRAV